MKKTDTSLETHIIRYICQKKRTKNDSKKANGKCHMPAWHHSWFLLGYVKQVTSSDIFTHGLLQIIKFIIGRGS